MNCSGFNIFTRFVKMLFSFNSETFNHFNLFIGLEKLDIDPIISGDLKKKQKES